MKFLFALLMATLFCTNAYAAQGGFSSERFQKVIYVKSGGAAANSGNSYDQAKSCAADADLWDIPAGTIIDRAYLIIDTGLAGTTNLDFGDDDDADGFIDSSLSVADLSVAGAYSLSAKLAGAYMRVQTAGGTDAADIDVVPAAKYYSAAGKELKMDLTTACTAGRFRVVVEGFYAGSK